MFQIQNITISTAFEEIVFVGEDYFHIGVLVLEGIGVRGQGWFWGLEGLRGVFEFWLEGFAGRFLSWITVRNVRKVLEDLKDWFGWIRFF